MFDASESVVVYLAWGAQALGVLSVVLARLHTRGFAQAGAQSFFLACLVAVGIMTVLAPSAGNVVNLSGGATLSLMAIGATLDLRRLEKPAI